MTDSVYTCGISYSLQILQMVLALNRMLYSSTLAPQEVDDICTDVGLGNKSELRGQSSLVN